MANENVQAILDRILAGLKSDDMNQQLAAIHELENVSFSSEAIVLQLEQLALHSEGAVQKFAVAALAYKNNQFVASQLSTLSKPNRKLILDEIDEWLADGLIEAQRAEVLRRHYDFDMQPAPTLVKSDETPAAVSVETPAKQPQPVTPA